MIRHYTYLEIPGPRRVIEAKRAREQIRNMMIGNFITPEQASYLQGRLRHIDAWEMGAIPAAKLEPEKPRRLALRQIPQLPQHHEIELTDGVKVDEDIR